MGTLNPACSRAYPPNRHLTCVRVAGHRGRHVWVDDNDLSRPMSSTLTWRDHADGCGCCYCVDAPAARAAEAVAP